MELFNTGTEENTYEHAITNKISAMLAYWDKNLICRYANAAYLEWFGRTREEMIDKMTLDELLGPMYQQNLPHIKGALAGKHQTFERIIPIPGGGGGRPALANYFPDIQDDEVKGFFVHAADITPIIAKEHPGNITLLNDNDHVLNHIEINLRENLLKGFPGIKNLSKTYFISETKLKSDFKARYNTTIFAYYRGLQMQLAHEYLVKAQYSKKQVALLLGFSNPSNFSACYKKHLNGKSHDKLS